jgi:hypothetical protein
MVRTRFEIPMRRTAQRRSSGIGALRLETHGLSNNSDAHRTFIVKDGIMSSQHFSRGNSLYVAAALALGLSGPALADDNSMSRLTGDSYAYFNNLDYSPGHFNAARKSTGADNSAFAQTSVQRPAMAERPVILAGHPARAKAPSPFRDDTGA